ncbi:MAG: hypothetical protein ABI543_11405 [Ignavibacteria bacterium]
MKKLNFIILILFSFTFFRGSDISSQTYDIKYTVEYALKDAGGNILSKMKMYRNGSKIRFVKLDRVGKPDSSTTNIYILKDEPKIYTIISNSAGKFGTKNAVEMSYVGMETGVYILDLGNDGSIFNSNSRAGTENVLGLECVKYTIASQTVGSDHASSDYYMYQDNLMLKRWVGNSSEGNSLEALNYDNTTDVPESMFIVPTDVQYLN